MVVVIKSLLFKNYPEIVFGFSTKVGADRDAPFYLNLSLSVDDNPEIVKENRKLFFHSLGLKSSEVALQKQVHSDIINVVNEGGVHGEGDALITNKLNLGLAISTADCTPIFIYDEKKKVIAAVHSGWRGTEKKILYKVLNKLKEDFKSSPENLIVYIGPSISQKNYEVGKEFADLFDKKYLKSVNDKFLLDVARANFDMLIEFGIRTENIQASSLCSFDMRYLLHSYRRDGKKSGRALGIIALKK